MWVLINSEMIINMNLTYINIIYELQPKFTVMESSIRDIFFFGN